MSEARSFIVAEINAMLSAAKAAIENGDDARAMLAFYRGSRRRFTAVIVEPLETWLRELPSIVQQACVDTLVWMDDSFVLDADVETYRAVLAGEAPPPREDPRSTSQLIAWAVTRKRDVIGVSESAVLPWHIGDDGTRHFGEIVIGSPPMGDHSTLAALLVECLKLPRKHEIATAIARMRRFGAISLTNGQTLLPTIETQGDSST